MHQKTSSMQSVDLAVLRYRHLANAIALLPVIDRC